MSQVFFAILAVAVFSFFAYSLRRRWLQITSIGQGIEEPRFDHILLRLRDVFVEGFLQKRMYKDFGAAVMHLLIFCLIGHFRNFGERGFPLRNSS